MAGIHPMLVPNEPLDSYIGGCARCGYDLRGLAEHRCPECGQPFDPTNSWPRPWLEWRGDAMRRSLAALGGAAFISCLFAAEILLLRHFNTGGLGSILVGVFGGALVLGGFVVGFVAVAVTGHWVWQEVCGAVARLVSLNATSTLYTARFLPGAPPRLSGPLSIALGVPAAILVMCLWLPGVILSPFWLPPTALAMFWLEHGRTTGRLAGALLTPYSIDTRRQFAWYLRWGCVLSALAVGGWIGCLIALKS